MQVVFRVDASNQLGTGHVMRCLTLADYLRGRKVNCLFIHRLHPGHMVDVIRARGHAVQTLPMPFTNISNDASVNELLGVTQQQDAHETIGVLENVSCDWLIVDHYGLNETWENILRPYTQRIAVIDDLADRCHDCDLLVDQNYFHTAIHRYDGLVQERTRRLCGPRYALLKSEYLEARRLIGPRRGPLSRVLVFYGGSDISNETSRALRVLSRPAFEHLAVDVVIGVNNMNQDALFYRSKERPLTEVHGTRESLIDLMIEADLAIGAGGSTTWERCALGLPSILTAVTHDQITVSETLAKDGLVEYLGPSSQVKDSDLANALHRLSTDTARLQDSARLVWQITDGLGALRVAEALSPCEQHELVLRPASRFDEMLYFDWANDPDTRRFAYNSEPIKRSQHEKWFQEKLSSSTSSLWVLTTPHGLPVGQARIDVNKSNAVLDYSVDPTFRRNGLGTRLLELVANAWRNNDCDSPLTAEVMPENTASRLAFLRSGCFTESPLPGGGWSYILIPASGSTPTNSDDIYAH